MKRKFFLLVPLIASLLFTVLFVQNPSISQASTSKKITLLVNTRQIYEGSNMTLAQAPTQIKNGVTYVPLRALGDIIGATTTYDAKTKDIVLTKNGNRLQLKPNSQTYSFNYETKTFPIGKPFLDKQTTMLPLRTIVEHFQATVTPKLAEGKIEIVFNENEAPFVPVPAQPSFTTDKSEYKIGESIQYFDTSISGSYKITKRKWINNEPAFFTAGPKQITLEVEDASGKVERATKTIYITNEVLYTREEYNIMHAKIGDKISLDGSSVLGFKAIGYTTNDKPLTLIRSNSPERINQEGIYYKDEIDGSARILIHQQNDRAAGAKMYIVAENKGTTDSYIHYQNTGLAGPSPYPSFTGKESVSSYLSGLGQSANVPTVRIPAGSKAILFPELSNKTMKRNDTITMYADIYSTSEVTLKIIALDATNHINDVYPFLQDVEAVRDGKHTRGTFPTGNREIVIREPVGFTKERLLFGDGKNDPYILGTDKMSGLEEINYGNRGVVYTMRLNEVAPNTTIIFNGRGGTYSGAIRVNGKVIRLPDQGVLSTPDDGVVLHRTKNQVEEIVIELIPASGSNLPLNLLFYPRD